MLLNHNPDATWVAMMAEYAAYFDDSGHPDDQAAVVVAGFIASEQQWLQFEQAWKEVLSKASIGIFHMADFRRDRTRPQHKKDTILRHLVNGIQEYTIRPFSHSVIMADYKKVNDLYPLEESVGSPYALAGRTVAKSLNIWKRDNMKEGDKLLVFFEDGTKHKGDFMDTMRRDGLPCPAFIDKTQAVPLQAADWLAWEMLRTEKTQKVDSLLRRLVKHFPEDDPGFGVYTKSDLIALCKNYPGGALPLRKALPRDTHIAHHSSPKKARRRTVR